MTQLLQHDTPLVPTFHPGIETLAGYAAGQLRAGFDVALAVHLRFCTQCRSEVAQMEAVGGGLLETIAPVQVDSNALTAVLGRLDEPAPAPTARSLDQLLASARRRWIAPGIWVATLDTPHDPNDSVFLLRVGVGRSTAPHIHRGAEITQVLTGALTDGDITYQAGDLVELDETNAHHPRVVGDKPCICLFAIQGKLEATTLTGRIAFALAGV